MQQRRPLNAQFHQRPYNNLMLGRHQDAATADIDSQASAGEMRARGRKTEPDPQFQWMAQLEPALAHKQATGNLRPFTFSGGRKDAGDCMR